MNLINTVNSSISSDPALPRDSASTSRSTSAEAFRQIMETVSKAGEAETTPEQEDSTVSAADEFSRYMAMSVADKIKHSMLLEMGLTEEEFDALPPEEKAKIEEQIAERIADRNNTSDSSNAALSARQANEQLQATLSRLNENKRNSLFDVS
ncbi:hypothetical protein [Halopseudomonas sp.]|uniref:hypothetical protein n=1 Tax=Halopseudomonas sp. TaxID=2901191 RepID=UPI0030033E09